MKVNTDILKTVESRLLVLKKLLEYKDTNKKILIKKIIETYELLQKYANNDSLYSKELKYYKIIDDNNENLRYKNSRDYFSLVQKELNEEYFSLYISSKIEGSPVEIKLLSSKPIELKPNQGVESLFERCKEKIGKEDIFIEYIGPLDNDSFIDFQEYASDKAICVRNISTMSGITISYYGGNDYEKVLSAIDNIDSYAKENGTDFTVAQYIKRH